MNNAQLCLLLSQLWVMVGLFVKDLTTSIAIVVIATCWLVLSLYYNTKQKGGITQ